jgi:hypothetical protein
MNLCIECIESYDYNMISFYGWLKIVYIDRIKLVKLIRALQSNRRVVSSNPAGDNFKILTMQKLVTSLT